MLRISKIHLDSSCLMMMSPVWQQWSVAHHVTQSYSAQSFINSIKGASPFLFWLGLTVNYVWIRHLVYLTDKQRKSIVCIDESIFSLFKHDPRKHVKKCISDTSRSDNFLGIIHRTGSSIDFWEAVLREGRGCVMHLRGITSGQVNCQIQPLPWFFGKRIRLCTIRFSYRYLFFIVKQRSFFSYLHW